MTLPVTQQHIPTSGYECVCVPRIPTTRPGSVLTNMSYQRILGNTKEEEDPRSLTGGRLETLYPRVWTRGLIEIAKCRPRPVLLSGGTNFRRSRFRLDRGEWTTGTVSHPRPLSGNSRHCKTECHAEVLWRADAP
ncbi:Hypothetical protein SMAX5B_018972 [Scophthalmus maximus]|uniref:Uncharacterized protein n=1 Tax=Scophthalmus maximus TaxID=52904 RepID=A0A2U9CA01_SCOMX|nr:Hypothetical protein SMAX5B_018972 [Scophthalmus maximus]